MTKTGETDRWEIKRVQSEKKIQAVRNKWIYRDGSKMSQTDRETGEGEGDWTFSVSKRKADFSFKLRMNQHVEKQNSHRLFSWVSVFRFGFYHLIQTWSRILQLRCLWSTCQITFRWQKEGVFVKWENLLLSHVYTNDNMKMFFTPSEVKVLKHANCKQEESRCGAKSVDTFHPKTVTARTARAQYEPETHRDEMERRKERKRSCQSIYIQLTCFNVIYI